MITLQELMNVAGGKQMDPTVVERDYALGWVLWGVSKDPVLSKRLIFKGGTSLRKCWFKDYRFSEDLDFTAREKVTADELRKSLESLATAVSEASGIPFDTKKIEVKTTMDFAGKEAYKGTLYFSGPRRDMKNPLRVKFDVSHYEKLVLPPVKRRVLHPYSDAADCKCSVTTYSIEEIIAEKLRALLQRSRPRDYYDVWYVLKSKGREIDTKGLVRAFKEKAEFKGVRFDSVDSWLSDDKLGLVAAYWDKQIGHQMGDVPKLESIRPEFNRLVAGLFK